MNESALIPFFTNFGTWLGLLFSVIIFSSLLGDHRLARLAQYVLVGLSMGYLAVLAIQYGLRPLLATVTLFDANSPGRWATLLLALLLFVAGCERLLRNGRVNSSGNTLRWLGLIPLGLMIGVGAVTLLIGVIQVTIVPQVGMLIGGDFSWDWLLAMILSVGVLFHLVIHPERHLSGQYLLLRQVMQFWMWIGQRALWLVAGILFVRIFAARYLLLTGLLDRWWAQLQSTELGAWFTTIFRG